MTQKAAQTEVAHTATPWQTRGMSDCVRIERRIDAGYLNIARCGTTKPGPHETDIQETWANAEFIVTACNSHDALVSALRGLVPNLLGNGNDIGCWGCGVVFWKKLGHDPDCSVAKAAAVLESAGAL